MKIQNILCPVDFSECSEAALEYAVRLAQDYSARLTVCHIVPDFFLVMGYPDRIPINRPVIIEEADQHLKGFLVGKIPDTVSLLKRILMANPPDAILQIAQETPADLIVMGTHGRTGLERFLVGSVTYKVLHKAPSPVVTVRSQAREFLKKQPFPFQKILCAVDFDGSKMKLLRVLGELGSRYGAEIFLFHVRGMGETESRVDEEKHRLEKIMLELAPDNKIVFLMEAGQTADEIIKATEKYKPDLLMVGHHSRLPAVLNVLGSVAAKVVSRVDCPVMVIRE